MPPKKKAATKASASKAAPKKAAAKSSSQKETGQTEKPKKENDPFVDSLIARRDKLLETADTEEKKVDIHMQLKGMYKCAKDKDTACLDKISENLKKIGGRPKRSKSKTRSRSRR